jgi:hypothetical protein
MRIAVRPLFGVAMLALAGGAAAASLDVRGEYGDLVDRGTVTLSAEPAWPEQFDCGTGVNVYREGREITLSVRRYVPTIVGARPCTGGFVVELGKLALGNWTAVLRVFADDGYEIAQRIERGFEIETVDGRCGPTPFLVPQVHAVHATLDAAAFIARLAAVPAWAATLGNPVARRGLPGDPAARGVLLTYPPLDDPLARVLALQDGGDFRDRRDRGGTGRPGLGADRTVVPRRGRPQMRDGLVRRLPVHGQAKRRSQHACVHHRPRDRRRHRRPGLGARGAGDVRAAPAGNAVSFAADGAPTYDRPLRSTPTGGEETGSACSP